MSIYGNASGGQATVLQSNNADKLDNKDSTEFAAASDVTKLNNLVGDTAVSTQIDTAITAAIPSVTTADNGKFMTVVNGAWAAEEVPDAEEASF